MSGPATGRRERAVTFRALLACLALIGLDNFPAAAQTITSDLFRPAPDGFMSPAGFAAAQGRRQHRPKRAMPPTMCGSATRTCPHRRGSATFRPTACPPPAAHRTPGFDSLNRTRKKPKFYPGQAKPKPPAGPGSPAPLTVAPALNGRVRLSIPPSESANKTPLPPAMAGNGHRSAASQAPQDRRRSVRPGRRLRRQFPGQVGARASRRL